MTGGFAILALVPWIGQIVRGQHQVHLTKLDPLFATPNLDLAARRDPHACARRAWRRRAHARAMGRVCGDLGARGLRRYALRANWGAQDDRFRYAVRVLAVTGLLTLAGHALAAVVGVDVFTQRYMTILIPVGAALGAAALVATRSRPLLIGAAALLVAVGVGGFVRRLGAQFEPDFRPVARAALGRSSADRADEHADRPLLPALAAPAARPAREPRRRARGVMRPPLPDHRRHAGPRRSPPARPRRANVDRDRSSSTVER